MEDKLQFRKKLAEILEFCAARNNIVERGDVEDFFGADSLTAEQLELVFDYLLSQKVIVKGYIKAGGSVFAAEKTDSVLSEEEVQYLKIYESDLGAMKPSDAFYNILPKVVEIAKKIHVPEVFIGDLIQEGNMGVMLASADGEENETELLRMAEESMQMMIESLSEEKVQDQKMVDKVQELDDQIEKITKEMGRKVTVDELAQFMDKSVDDIMDVIRLAGEEIDDEDGDSDTDNKKE